MKGLTRQAQIVLYVTDMNRSVTFWRDEIGLNLTWPHGLSDYSGQSWVTLDACGFELALHPGGDGERKVSPAFCFFVESLEEAMADLEGRGVWLEGIRNPQPGVFFCPARDPDGHLFFIKPREQS